MNSYRIDGCLATTVSRPKHSPGQEVHGRQSGLQSPLEPRATGRPDIYLDGSALETTCREPRPHLMANSILFFLEEMPPQMGISQGISPSETSYPQIIQRKKKSVEGWRDSAVD